MKTTSYINFFMKLEKNLWEVVGLQKRVVGLPHDFPAHLRSLLPLRTGKAFHHGLLHLARPAATGLFEQPQNGSTSWRPEKSASGRYLLDIDHREI
jgi:hypothetical protein